MFPDFTFDKNVKLQNLAKNHENSGKNHQISRKFQKFRIYLPDEFSVHFFFEKSKIWEGDQKIESGLSGKLSRLLRGLGVDFVIIFQTDLFSGSASNDQKHLNGRG